MLHANIYGNAGVVIVAMINMVQLQIAIVMDKTLEVGEIKCMNMIAASLWVTITLYMETTN